MNQKQTNKQKTNKQTKQNKTKQNKNKQKQKQKQKRNGALVYSFCATKESKMGKKNTSVSKWANLRMLAFKRWWKTDEIW